MRVFFSLPLLFTLLLCCSLAPDSEAGVTDKGYAKTLEALSSVICGDDELLNYNKGLIRALSYTNKRALRAFSLLPDISAEELVLSLKRLVNTPISFDNLLLFERFVTLQGADVDNSWQFLEKMEALPYLPGRAMTGFELVDVLTAQDFLAAVDRVEQINEAGGWAVKAFMELPGHSREGIVRGIGMVESMREKQQWAVEQCCRMKGMDEYWALEVMAALRGLSGTDAWNARGLMKQDV
ncbi:MAG: hypothetical protein ABFR63_07370, partial [Thermodesulfobacteriota bacterium]